MVERMRTEAHVGLTGHTAAVRAPSEVIADGVEEGTASGTSGERR